MMKKTLSIAFSLLFCSGLVFGQKNNVQSAASNLKKGNLEKAKEYIDLAAEHETTANDYKMWYYRGGVYWELYQKDTSVQSIAALETAIKSYEGCIKTDKSGRYSDPSKVALMNIAVACFNGAQEASQKKNYSKTMQLYEKVMRILPHDENGDLKAAGITKKALLLYSSYAAQDAKMYDKAIGYVEQLMEAGEKTPELYLSAAKLSLMKGDKEQALRYLEKGRVDHPNDEALMIEELNLYIAMERTEEVWKKLEEAIAKAPENKGLYYFRGNKRSAIGGEENYNKAVADFEKAIELDPAYFLAISDLGVLYYNWGAEIVNEANAIKDNKKYQAEVAKADEKFKAAQPYLEQAMKLNPKDKTTLATLAQLYVRLKMNDRYLETKKMLDNL